MKQFVYCDTIEEAEKIIEKLGRNPNISMINLSKHNLLLSYNIEINNIKDMDVRLNIHSSDTLLYDYFMEGEFICHIEVQFNGYEFNGKIWSMTEDENENIEYEEITDGALYEYLEKKAIEDFNRLYN